MQHNKLVSLITPCYNGANFVHRLLDSLLSQTYKHLEIIFVNDGSTDATEEIVKGYIPRFEQLGISFIYIYQQNAGQASALNKGLKIFTGDYLMWPDSDDYLSEDAVFDKVAFLEKHEAYGFVRSNGWFFDYNDTSTVLRRISNRISRFDTELFAALLNNKTYFLCGCYMVRAEAFYAVYPQKQIFESREGQNWQMLIPIAYRNLCGYIDKDQYFIAERCDSHSRVSRTLTEEIERNKGLQSILINAIDAAKVKVDEYDLYTKCIKNKFVKSNLKLCFFEKEKALAKMYYTDLREQKLLRFKDRMYYFGSRNPFLNTLCIATIKWFKHMKKK